LVNISKVIGSFCTKITMYYGFKNNRIHFSSISAIEFMSHMALGIMWSILYADL
jgi:hypothetical protein